MQSKQGHMCAQRGAGTHHSRCLASIVLLQHTAGLYEPDACSRRQGSAALCCCCKVQRSCQRPCSHLSHGFADYKQCSIRVRPASSSCPVVSLLNPHDLPAIDAIFVCTIHSCMHFVCCSMNLLRSAVGRLSMCKADTCIQWLKSQPRLPAAACHGRLDISDPDAVLDTIDGKPYKARQMIEDIKMAFRTVGNPNCPYTRLMFLLPIGGLGPL